MMQDMQYAWVTDEFAHLQPRFAEPLAPFTYFKIGGPADVFICVESQQDLVNVVCAARKHHMPLVVLGGGSNVLVSDKGVRGIVVQNKTSAITYEEVNEHQSRVIVDSGVVVNILVRETVEKGLSGLHVFLGLPGTVGGAVVNNSHYTQELFGTFVESVLVVDEHGEKITYEQKDLEFAYDHSVLQHRPDVVVEVRLLLAKGSTPLLQKYLLDAVRHRADTQPLGSASSGCMFQNLQAEDGTMVSAGKLIDEAGCKGLQLGGAVVSQKHANFILNTGSATAEDVRKLVEMVENRVLQKHGIKLKREVFFIGEW